MQYKQIQSSSDCASLLSAFIVQQTYAGISFSCAITDWIILSLSALLKCWLCITYLLNLTSKPKWSDWKAQYVFLICISTEESNSYTAPGFYISGTFQQQNFNRLLSPKPRVGPSLPMVTNKLQLSFLGSRFFYNTSQAYYTYNQLPFLFTHSTKVQDIFWRSIAGFEIKKVLQCCKESLLLIVKKRLDEFRAMIVAEDTLYQSPWLWFTYSSFFFSQS